MPFLPVLWLDVRVAKPLTLHANNDDQSAQTLYTLPAQILTLQRKRLEEQRVRIGRGLLNEDKVSLRSVLHSPPPASCPLHGSPNLIPPNLLLLYPLSRPPRIPVLPVLPHGYSPTDLRAFPVNLAAIVNRIESSVCLSRQTETLQVDGMKTIFAGCLVARARIHRPGRKTNSHAGRIRAHLRHRGRL